MSEKMFSGKSVLITGGARGMGRSHALGFAREGALVAVLDLGKNRLEVAYRMPGQDELEQTVTECRRLSGAKAIAVQADVRDSAQVEAAVARTAGELGG